MERGQSFRNGAPEKWSAGSKEVYSSPLMQMRGCLAATIVSVS